MRPLSTAWVRRRQTWLFVTAIVLAIRIALPSLVRLVLIVEASDILRTRVEVGDVDLSLLRGGIALENVVVHDPGRGEMRIRQRQGRCD
jgi:hypothetical protein